MKWCREPRCNPRRHSRIPPQIEKKHVVPTSSQDEALAHYGVSREVPCSALKGETVPDSLPAPSCAPGGRHCGWEHAGSAAGAGLTLVARGGGRLMVGCFSTVMLEKTLESPLDSKDIKTSHSYRKSTLNIHWKD